MQQAARQMSMRFVALFAAFCMAMAMVPAMALATVPTTGTFTLDATSVEVTSGTTVDLSTLLNPTPNADLDGNEYHFDYVASTETTAFTVNKHSGVLTASTVSEDTTGSVTIYLLDGNTPTKNSGKPCTGFTVLSSQVVTIDVTTSSTYGYQGNSMTMKMTSPTVTSYSGSNSTGWVNSLGSISAADDGYYYFTVKLSSGFQTYNTPASFAKLNEDNIVLKNSTGTIATLTKDNDTAVQVYSTDHSSKTVQVRVLASAVTGSNVQLVFQADFHGNNASNTLGCPIAFVIG